MLLLADTGRGQVKAIIRGKPLFTSYIIHTNSLPSNQAMRNYNGTCLLRAVHFPRFDTCRAVFS